MTRKRLLRFKFKVLSKMWLVADAVRERLGQELRQTAEDSLPKHLRVKR